MATLAAGARFLLLCKAISQSKTFPVLARPQDTAGRYHELAACGQRSQQQRVCARRHQSHSTDVKFISHSANLFAFPPNVQSPWTSAIAFELSIVGEHSTHEATPYPASPELRTVDHAAIFTAVSLDRKPAFLASTSGMQTVLREASFHAARARVLPVRLARVTRTMVGLCAGGLTGSLMSRAGCSIRGGAPMQQKSSGNYSIAASTWFDLAAVHARDRKGGAASVVERDPEKMLAA
ncbi:hypothetical protein HWV62_43309 [Athelia sp. TMB]|nr:hypothetical protein HWV62_43309 [Athelia sp. TMB]